MKNLKKILNDEFVNTDSKQISESYDPSIADDDLAQHPNVPFHLSPEEKHNKKFLKYLSAIKKTNPELYNRICNLD